MAKKDINNSPAMQFMKQMGAGAEAQPEPIRPELVAINTPMCESAKAQKHIEVIAQKTKLNVAFIGNNYEYLKLITLLDKTTITAYINKLVEADLKKRKSELQRIKDIIA